MLAPALRLGTRALRSNAPGLQFVRGLFHVGGMMLWFAALPFVTLPELTAIGFSGPIFICLGATLFLGERMSGARWAAVLIGFSGVLLVVQPWAPGGFSGISRGVLLMLASAPVFAGSFLVAKTLTNRRFGNWSIASRERLTLLTMTISASRARAMISDSSLRSYSVVSPSFSSSDQLKSPGLSV